jgi:uncharacterized Zn finger protein (UPF0148 family)
MQDRRALHTARVTHVSCRACEAPVPLDADKMVLHATHGELSCPACGAPVQVRRTDVEIKPEGVWTIPCYTEDTVTASELEYRGLLLLRAGQPA